MSEREKQVFWLFWRCYDTVISHEIFEQLFGAALIKKFPFLMFGLKSLGLAKDKEGLLHLIPLGSFCFHYIEKQYSLKYLNKLWDVSMKNAWPQKLEL